ncbi:thioredoxin [Marinobacterium aestuarii]|uniref:Thioredoxin n=1 Tax=Marinobacterium aestuarii TaxID=1821621 RepID=A0A1A9F015_9GAMM|nr:DsbA family oxidoreductase [Marinobacterium aestuarii]ANG63432.1 thioredoxin [Marinobacterium aestuarii]
MANKIQIDIISDVVCPWCIIGYKYLEKAITELGLEDRVAIEWKPFELNPDMPAEGENLRAHIARKYGSSPEESAKSRASMTKIAGELGFTFDFHDAMKIVNTRNAHILLAYAREQGKQHELQMRLFEAVFSNRQDVSDKQVLAEILESVSLNAAEALAELDNPVAREKITGEEEYWRSMGVSSVPTIVFNRKGAVTGAHPTEVFKQVLTEIVEQG